MEWMAGLRAVDRRYGDAADHAVGLIANDWADALAQALALAGREWVVESLFRVMSASEQRGLIA
ncbi:MAG: hypothetical protein FJW64_10285 [Actinobacteria bacterium]|nr:hypothetical protein [Actinomycetota bacterium]